MKENLKNFILAYCLEIEETETPSSSWRRNGKEHRKRRIVL